MQLNRIDLNLFVVFDVIYTERNLTRAAEVLNLTQPTVSNSLARLREMLNDQLFVRTPQGMVPTPMAENIIGPVREALGRLETSVREGQHFNPAESRRIFRFSMNDVSEYTLLPPLMQLLQQEAPGMGIESYHTRRRDLPRALASGEVELAIDIPEAADKSLCHAPLYDEDYVCVLRDDHPAARGRLSLEKYLSLQHVHVSSRRRGPGMVDVQLNKLGHQREIALRMQHYLVVPGILRNSDLAMTVPSRWAERAGLKALKLPFEVPSQQWHLLWHRSADGDQANRWLRERVITLML